MREPVCSVISGSRDRLHLWKVPQTLALPHRSPRPYQPMLRQIKTRLRRTPWSLETDGSLLLVLILCKNTSLRKHLSLKLFDGTLTHVMIYHENCLSLNFARGWPFHILLSFTQFMLPVWICLNCLLLRKNKSTAAQIYVTVIIYIIWELSCSIFSLKQHWNVHAAGKRLIKI